MKLEDLKFQTWSQIPKEGNPIEGYKGSFIKIGDSARTDMLLFRDEADQKHFVVEVSETQSRNINTPEINGFKVSAKMFRFDATFLKYYIDLECGREEYLKEFTEIVKEIAGRIAEGNDAVRSINEVIENWKAFLGAISKPLLTPNEQLGLFAELELLSRICEINPSLSLRSWRGPVSEKHDFVFSDWTLEVKATQKHGHIHVINGLEQLQTYKGKKLAFVSLIINEGQSGSSKSIQDLVNLFVTKTFKGRPALLEEFLSLVTSAGYSRLYSQEYNRLKFEVVASKLFSVDDHFPKLTPNEISIPVSSRVSEIKYTIDLTGMNGIEIEDVQWGNYLY
ncbi:MAG: PD-(D/E)XK motif protein [Chitinophagaceae bacterium]|nr:PD-(D/E)XK motif protein [Chitinophagaceae bacterium]